MLPIVGIGHVVYYSLDPSRVAAFYQDVLELNVAERVGDEAIFLRGASSKTDFDIGFVRVPKGSCVIPTHPRLGVYHVALSIATLEGFVSAHDRLVKGGHAVGSADHGSHLSVYAVDPDGNETEVCWYTPVEEWKSRGFGFRPLDLHREIHNRSAQAAGCSKKEKAG